MTMLYYDLPRCYRRWSCHGYALEDWYCGSCGADLIPRIYNPLTWHVWFREFHCWLVSPLHRDTGETE